MPSFSDYLLKRLTVSALAAVFLATVLAAPALAAPVTADLRLTETGWTKPVGTWDPVTRTAVLTQDLTETVVIEADNVTLDGNGHSDLAYLPVGVYLGGRTGVTIQNLSVGVFLTGVLFEDSTGCAFVDGAAAGSGTSVRISGGSGNRVSGNDLAWPGHGEVTAVEATGSPNVVVSSNYLSYSRIVVRASDGASVTGNTVGYNYASDSSGILIQRTSGATIEDNSVSMSERGLTLDASSGNTVRANNLSFNRLANLLLKNGSDRNEITLNDIADSDQSGVFVSASNDNRFYHNNVSGDWGWLAFVESGSGNLFSLPAPVGGNWWGRWTGPDANGDGFVDAPYDFYGGTDYLPFTLPGGWDVPEQEPRPTLLSFADDSAATGQYSDPATLAATLTQAGAPVAGARIAFTLGELSVEATTASDGTARLTTDIGLPAGSYTLTASFAGDSELASSTVSRPFEVAREDVSVTMTADPPQPVGGTAHLSATLRDADDASPLPGKAVVFHLGAASVTATTGADGKASASVPLKQGEGLYTVDAAFLGDDFHSAAKSVPEQYAVYDPYSGRSITLQGWMGARDSRWYVALRAYYQTGASKPYVRLRLIDTAARISLRDTAAQWVVFTGASATVSGNCSVNGIDGYRYLLVAQDASAGLVGAAKISIKVTTGAGVPVYERSGQMLSGRVSVY